MTGSGFYGTVVSTDFDDNKIQLELAKGVVITVALNAIMSVVEDEAPAAPLTEDVEPASTESQAPAEGGVSEDSSKTAQ
jgi:preprotein translocase subunit